MNSYLQPSELTIDHAIQPRKGLTKGTVDQYVADIEAAKDWPFPPIKAVEDGETLWLFDGFHRVEALSKARQIAGLENITAAVDITPGTRRDAVLLAMQANLKNSTRLTLGERRASAIRLLKDPEWSRWSNNKLAKFSGVCPNTVGALRKLHSEGDDQLRIFTDRYGNQREMNTSAIGKRSERTCRECQTTGPPSVFVEVDLCGDCGGASMMEDYTLDNDDDNIDVARNDARPSAPMSTGLAGSEMATATNAEIGGDSRGSHSGGTDEHGIVPGAVIVATTTATNALDRMRRTDLQPTSRELVLSSQEVRWFTPNFPAEPARKVMGGIELDPASCTEANERIQAERFYTEDDDGLSLAWKARSLWFNPPYGGQTSTWVNKLIGHYRADDIGQAMALLNAVPHRRWFQRLWSVSAAVCFLDDMIRFHAPGGERGAQPTYGNVLFYLTTGSVGDFVEAFTPHGRVVVAQSAAAQLVRRDPAMKILIEGATP